MPTPADPARIAAARETNTAIVTRMLTEPVRKWSGFRWRLHCPSCRENREIEIARMIDQGYGDWLMQRALDGFKCQVCGQAPDEVTLRHHVAVWRLRWPEGREWSD